MRPGQELQNLKIGNINIIERFQKNSQRMFFCIYLPKSEGNGLSSEEKKVNLAKSAQS